MSAPTVLLAGGGTGGHVFPLVAVAHAIKHLNPAVRAVFVGTARGMETKFVPEQGFELELMDALPMRGGGIGGVFRGALRAAALVPAARELIHKYDARAVLSIGGYAAGPVCVAARTLGLPVGLMEPNSVIGLANRLSAPFVQRAYTAFEVTERNFSPGVVVHSGVPLRPGFDQVPPRLAQGPIRVLVLGGSQGAKALNQLVPAALCQVRQHVVVTHQCGAAHLEAVTARYQECGASSSSKLQVEVIPFIDDMPRALADADLVIGRAGAGAVSEIAAVGRPSLLVPYPFASGDHQRGNAEALERAGAARCVVEAEATVERIALEVGNLVRDRSTLRAMARAAAAEGRPRAAEVVARDFLALAGLIPAIRGAAPTGGEQAARKQLSEVA